jgi:tetratricopeptide (TPR) repeat protein
MAFQNASNSEIDAAARRAKTEGREREILPALTQAAEQRRSEPLLWQWKGLLHLELGECAQAIEAFTRAAHLAPTDGKIAHALARTTFSAGIPSVHLFQRASQLDPGNGDILLGLVAALCADGYVAEAIAGLDQMLAANPQWAAGHEALCRLKWERGDRTGFTASLENALLKAGSSETLWRSLVLLTVHARDWRSVFDILRRARAAIGDKPLLRANEAVALSETGQFLNADPLFEQLANEPDPLFAVQRMRHELRAGRPDRAAAVGDQWTKHPASDFIWPYLSIAWRLLGDERRLWLERDMTLARSFDLPINAKELDRLAHLLDRLHHARSAGLDQSVRGGTQTDGHLLHRIEPELQHLRRLIEAAVETYKSDLPEQDLQHPFLSLPRDQEVRFSGAWSVRLRQHGHHAHHIHPAGWISSAFYVALPEKMAGNDDAGRLALGAPPDELNLGLGPERIIDPKPGRLILFPSIMWHGTIPFASGERVTVACDVSRPKAQGHR